LPLCRHDLLIVMQGRIGWSRGGAKNARCQGKFRSFPRKREFRVKYAGPSVSRQCQLILDALCAECAVRLMKDHFVDNRALATEFNNEALQFEDAEPSALLRCKVIGWLVVRIQHEMAIRIQRHPMRRRAALEIADASLAEGRVGAVAGRKAQEHDILDHRLKRR
jgi:hypothetical protein